MTWKSIITSLGFPLITAIFGGLMGGPLWDFIKTSQEPKISIVSPANGQHISTPLNLVMKYQNLPAENYICAFIQGSEEHLYYPLISKEIKTEEDGDLKLVIPTIGTQDDNGKIYTIVAGIADNSAYAIIRDVYEGKDPNKFGTLPIGFTAKKWVRIYRKGQ